MKQLLFAAAVVVLVSCTPRPTVQDSMGLSSAASSGMSESSGVSDEWETFDWGDRTDSFAISYPKGWEFACCGDMDHGSWHHLYPKRSSDDVDNDYTIPAIHILEWSALRIPPDDGQLYDPADERTVGPAEFATWHLRSIDDGQKLSQDIDALQPTGKSVRLKNFPVDVPVYEGKSVSGVPITAYMIQTETRFLDVLIYRPDDFDGAVLDQILARLASR